MYDLVEWAAAQPWSNGEVGMVGISYSHAPRWRPPWSNPAPQGHHANAGTFDLYDSAYHHGLFSSSFVTPSYS